MDHILAQVMPKNFLESDDELEVWSSTSSSSSGRKSISPTDLQFRKGQFERKDDHFSIFQDYFGLSNLLQNVKISDDNPLLYEHRRNLTSFNKTKRLSWESDGSDPNVVISPIGQNMPFTYGTNGDFPSTDNYQRPQIQEPTFKNLPPPSMRLSKAARDQIISGAYQNQLNRCRSEKIPSPPPQPPQSHVQLQVGNVNTVRPQATVQVCVFCRNNGESEAVYSSHVLKDAEGRTSCPILRAYTCPICKANGDNSHTIKYCPLNQQQNGQGRLQQQQNANLINKGSRGIRPPPLSMNGRVVKPH